MRTVTPRVALQLRRHLGYDRIKKGNDAALDQLALLALNLGFAPYGTITHPLVWGNKMEWAQSTDQSRRSPVTTQGPVQRRPRFQNRPGSPLLRTESLRAARPECSAPIEVRVDGFIQERN